MTKREKLEGTTLCLLYCVKSYAHIAPTGTVTGSPGPWKAWTVATIPMG